MSVANEAPHPPDWKVISSEYLHRHAPWLTVRKDVLELPGGHRIPAYYVLEYPDWINVIGITRDGQLLLIRQYRHAIAMTSYELCAGVCDEEDASPLEAAKRELMEETGYGNGHWEEWMVICANPATSNNRVHCFIARDIEQLAPPAPDPSEQISVHLFSQDELMPLMNSGQIIQATHLAALWKYLALNPKK